ncbi:hypothetical protein ACF1HJ_33555 [Streptomyces sp. NPDC013978]|uniref:hypothetical protein n=1 Tax=Streptomyces sp. NPDC013978 TaxID=3364869 RepID=UPI0036FBAB28
MLLEAGGVESADEAVDGSCGLEFFVSFFELAGQLDYLSFQSGDPALELFDVVGGVKARLPPHRPAQELRELGLQVPDAGGETVAAVQGVDQVRLRTSPADEWASVAPGRFSAYGMYVGEQVLVAVEEGAVDSGLSCDARDADGRAGAVRFGRMSGRSAAAQRNLLLVPGRLRLLDRGPRAADHPHLRGPEASGARLAPLPATFGR